MPRAQVKSHRMLLKAALQYSYVFYCAVYSKAKVWLHLQTWQHLHMASRAGNPTTVLRATAM